MIKGLQCAMHISPALPDFIGFYLAELLLQEGWSVTGLDGLTDHYDVRLKHRRLQMLGRI